MRLLRGLAGLDPEGDRAAVEAAMAQVVADRVEEVQKLDLHRIAQEYDPDATEDFRRNQQALADRAVRALFD